MYSTASADLGYAIFGYELIKACISCEQSSSTRGSNSCGWKHFGSWFPDTFCMASQRVYFESHIVERLPFENLSFQSLAQSTGAAEFRDCISVER